MPLRFWGNFYFLSNKLNILILIFHFQRNSVPAFMSNMQTLRYKIQTEQEIAIKAQSINFISIDINTKEEIQI
jgi:hypothetical protein